MDGGGKGTRSDPPEFNRRKCLNSTNFYPIASNLQFQPIREVFKGQVEGFTRVKNSSVPARLEHLDVRPDALSTLGLLV